MRTSLVCINLLLRYCQGSFVGNCVNSKKIFLSSQRCYGPESMVSVVYGRVSELKPFIPCYFFIISLSTESLLFERGITLLHMQHPPFYLLSFPSWPLSTFFFNLCRRPPPPPPPTHTHSHINLKVETELDFKHFAGLPYSPIETRLIYQ